MDRIHVNEINAITDSDVECAPLPLDCHEKWHVPLCLCCEGVGESRRGSQRKPPLPVLDEGWSGRHVLSLTLSVPVPVSLSSL